MVCTNNLITLYDIKISKQKAKSVKQIPITAETISGCFFEPMASTLVIVDGKGQVTVFYLALYNQKTKQGASKLSKQFSLDIQQTDP